jgi:translation initiation factor IF-3
LDQRPGEATIPPPLRPRRPLAPPPPLNGPKFDQFIESPKVRVIDQNGDNLGVMYTREARALAEEVGLNLVEISPNADPPVAKFLDIGKFKYENQKKQALARKNQKTQEIKEIKVRPGIDQHDYDVKLKAVQRFIEEGDKVKITLRFRGREMAHNDIGVRVLERMQNDTSAYAKVEQAPRFEGRQVLMVIAPK